MSYNLNDVASAANDGMANMEERAAREIGRAKHGIDAAKDAASGAARSASDTLSLLMKGIAATVSVVSLVRQADRGLGLLGLSRRRSPLLSLGVFGAGVAVGTGVGLLFAPASGADTRRAVAARFQALLGRTPTAPPADADAAATTDPAPVIRPATVVPQAAPVGRSPASAAS